jgi:hypothetical protein
MFYIGAVVPQVEGGSGHSGVMWGPVDRSESVSKVVDACMMIWIG